MFTKENIIAAEDCERAIITEQRIDIDGDKRDEQVKAIYGEGISNKPLSIEIFKDGRLISTLKDEFGIQSNYTIKDVDGDGIQEIVIWGGLWDPRLPGDKGVTVDTYEGHSSSHRYIVATYKFIRGEFFLWEIYTTKKKYEPYCGEQPK